MLEYITGLDWFDFDRVCMGFVMIPEAPFEQTESIRGADLQRRMYMAQRPQLHCFPGQAPGINILQNTVQNS